jgi:hypothetical protein
MRKVTFCFAFVFAASLISFAQKGNNAINVGPDIYLGLKTWGDEFKPGIGGHVKGLYGISTAGQVGLSVGFASFKGKDASFFDYTDYKFSMLPVLASYRHHFNDLFVEPQLGFSHGNEKYKDQSIQKQTKFIYAIGVGYLIKAFEVDLNFQNVNESGEIALRGGLAYNIPLKKK